MCDVTRLPRRLGKVMEFKRLIFSALAKVGSVSVGTAVGDGPGRLLGERERLGVLQPRQCSGTGVQMGRGRAARDYRPRVPAVLRGRALEWPRHHPEGCPESASSFGASFRLGCGAAV